MDPVVMLLVVVVVLLLLYMSGVGKYLSGVGKYLSQVWFSFFMNFMNPQYNAAVRKHKETLFQNLGSNNSSEEQQSSPTGQEKLTILEIGCGPGGSLHMYPKNINVDLVAVEPNVHHKKYLEANIVKYNNINLKRFVVCGAESMDEIESNSFETVICTIVLCSVNCQVQVLREIKRVLKPGGKFYFMEHVSSEPGTWLYRIQHFINNIWFVLCDGCNVTRDTARTIQGAGFSDVHLNRFMASDLSRLFYPVYPHISGYAVKGSD